MNKGFLYEEEEGKILKVAVFGASGGVGQHLFTQSIQRGFQVTAFVRNPDKIQFKHPRLLIIKGDVMNSSSVEKAIIGQDAILCALGVPLGSKEPVCSVGTSNILQAMDNHKISRFITVSGIDLTELSRYNLFERVFLYFFSLTDKKAIEDKWKQEEIIKESSSNWTIVRPPWLTKGPVTKNYRHGTALRATLLSRISRADVAHFMLEQLSNQAYIKSDPIIYNK